MDIFRYDSKFIQTLNKFADMMIISTLWALTCMTVIGIGPACCAAYHAMAKSVRYERGRVVKEYFRSLINSFWQGMLFGLLLTVFALSVYLVDIQNNLEFLKDGTNLNFWSLLFLIVKSVIVVVLSLYVFPLISRFKMPFVRIFVASILMSIRYFISTAIMMALLIFAVYCIINLPYLIFLLPGMFSYVQGGYMEKIMRNNMTPEELEEDESIDQWWL